MRVCDDCTRAQGDSLAAAVVPVDAAACRRYTRLELIVELAIRLQPIGESKQSAPRGARWLPPFGQQSEAELRVCHPGMSTGIEKCTRIRKRKVHQDGRGWAARR